MPLESCRVKFRIDDVGGTYIFISHMTLRHTFFPALPGIRTVALLLIASIGLVWVTPLFASGHTPSNLVANTISPYQINLSWTGSAPRYQLERCYRNPTYCTVFWLSATSFSDRGLIPGTLYDYRVLAYDSNGQPSSYSNLATATTPAAIPNPNLTVTLAANATTLPAPANLTLTATVSSGLGISRVEFFLNRWLIATSESPPYTANLQNLLRGSYEFWARATDNSDGSKASASVFVTVNPGPDLVPPTVPGNLLGNAGDRQAHLNWGVATDATSPPVHYHLERCSPGSPLICTAFLLGSTQFTDRMLENSNDYDYRVKAIDAVGNASGFSNVVRVRPGSSGGDSTPPTAPANLIVNSTSSTSIALSWNAASDNVAVTGYRVYRNASLVATVTSLGYNDTGLAPQTPYNYVVYAIDAAANISPASAEVGTITAAAPVNGISANAYLVNAGGSLTLSGPGGFGVKSIPAPFKWDDFENGTPGSTLSTRGWEHYQPGSPFPQYTNLQAYSGTRSAYNNMIIVPPIVENFNTAGLKGLAATEVYFSYLFRWEVVSGSTGGGFFKLLRGNGAPNFYSTRPRFYTSLNPGAPLVNAGYSYTGADADGAGEDFISVPANTWHRFEGYYKLSTPAGSNTGALQTWTNLDPNVNLTNVMTLSAPQAGLLLDNFLLPLMASNLPAVDLRLYVDDIYVDRTRARVEIGDANTWAGCTRREVQIASAWSDQAITVNVNRGGFAPGSTAYVYVVNAAGQVNPNGVPVRFSP